MSNENQNQNSAVVGSTATTPLTDTSIIRGDDIIEIDAGGKIIKTRRSTLTLVPLVDDGHWNSIIMVVSS